MAGAGACGRRYDDIRLLEQGPALKTVERLELVHSQEDVELAAEKVVDVRGGQTGDKGHMVSETAEMVGKIRHEQSRKGIDQPHPDQGQLVAADVPEQRRDLPGVGDEGARPLAQEDAADREAEGPHVAVEKVGVDPLLELGDRLRNSRLRESEDSRRAGHRPAIANGEEDLERAQFERERIRALRHYQNL